MRVSQQQGDSMVPVKDASAGYGISGISFCENGVFVYAYGKIGETESWRAMNARCRQSVQAGDVDGEQSDRWT